MHKAVRVTWFGLHQKNYIRVFEGENYNQLPAFLGNLIVNQFEFKIDYVEQIPEQKPLALVEKDKQ